MASGEGGIVAGELMASEIAEQPAIVAGLLRAERDHVQEIAAALRARWEEIAFVSIAARGTSDNAARYAQYLFGALTGRAVALATPALFTLYETPPDLRRALTIGISQSGASPDIVAVLTEARRQGAPTLAITNDPDSPLAGAAEFVLPIHAGIERSVAATKTYMAAIAPTIAATTRLDAAIARGAERYRDIGQLVTGGRGYCYGTAFEAALKLKETCYLLAEPYSPPDFIHGPVAIIEPGYPALLIAPSGATFADMLAFAGILRERGADLLIVSDRDEILALADTPLPGQLLALSLARLRGYDPDRPRGLSKVTLTR